MSDGEYVGAHVALLRRWARVLIFLWWASLTSWIGFSVWSVMNPGELMIIGWKGIAGVVGIATAGEMIVTSPLLFLAWGLQRRAKRAQEASPNAG